MKRLIVSSLFSLLIALSAAGTVVAQPILINLSHPLNPYRFVPSQLSEPQVLTSQLIIGQPESELEPQTAEHIQQLFSAAKQQGIELVLTSGYRSFDQQQAIFQQALAINDQQKEVAPPGFSEHQTGLAADVGTTDTFCAGQPCFMMTKAASWLEENAYHFGFIIRYPRDASSITGYAYEPWHLRYVGESTASEIKSHGITLEQYLAGACFSHA